MQKAAGGGRGTSKLGAAASDVGLVDDDTTCRDESCPPNNASPHRDGSLTKSVTKQGVRLSLARMETGLLDISDTTSGTTRFR